MITEDHELHELAIDQLSEEIHEENVERGWWDDRHRCLHTVLLLVISEISEATEAVRRDLMDDKLPHRKGVEVELADAFIRLLDFGGRLGLKVSQIPSDSSNIRYHKKYPHACVSKKLCYLCIEYINASLPKKLCCLCSDITRVVESLGFDPRWHGGPWPTDKKLNRAYARAVLHILAISSIHDLDLMGAVTEKRSFNKTRLDHNRDERNKEHGKKF